MCRYVILRTSDFRWIRRTAETADARLAPPDHFLYDSRPMASQDADDLGRRTHAVIDTHNAPAMFDIRRRADEVHVNETPPGGTGGGVDEHISLASTQQQGRILYTPLGYRAQPSPDEGTPDDAA